MRWERGIRNTGKDCEGYVCVSKTWTNQELIIHALNIKPRLYHSTVVPIAAYASEACDVCEVHEKAEPIPSEMFSADIEGIHRRRD